MAIVYQWIILSACFISQCFKDLKVTFHVALSVQFSLRHQCFQPHKPCKNEVELLFICQSHTPKSSGKFSFIFGFLYNFWNTLSLKILDLLFNLWAVLVTYLFDWVNSRFLPLYWIFSVTSFSFEILGKNMKYFYFWTQQDQKDYISF